MEHTSHFSNVVSGTVTAPLKDGITLLLRPLYGGFQATLAPVLGNWGTLLGNGAVYVYYREHSANTGFIPLLAYNVYQGDNDAVIKTVLGLKKFVKYDVFCEGRDNEGNLISHSPIFPVTTLKVTQVNLDLTNP